MDLRTRLIAPLFHNDVFDLDAFVKRIILFETYIIDSKRLTEIPYLLQAFGFDGLLELLESGNLKINCFVSSTGSLGPTFFIGEPQTSKVRPPFHFSFARVQTADINHHVNLLLQKVEPQTNLSGRKIVRFRKAIYKSLENPTEAIGDLSLEITRDELVLSSELLAEATVMALKNQIGIQAASSEIEISIQYNSVKDFRAVTNIGARFGLDELVAHKVVESACLAIAKRNDRIAQMKSYSALSGFSNTDLPIFGRKLSFLASAISPKTDEDKFQRVIELTGLPQIKNTSEIDAKKLLKIRNSTEAAEFRQWLRTTNGLSDAEIVKHVRSLSKAIGTFLGGEIGQNIRFLITNGIGFIPVVGQAISIPLSILDHFVVDKLFPRSGVVTFIDDMYPSIFKD